VKTPPPRRSSRSKVANLAEDGDRRARESVATDGVAVHNNNNILHPFPFCNITRRRRWQPESARRRVRVLPPSLLSAPSVRRAVKPRRPSSSFPFTLRTPLTDRADDHPLPSRHKHHRRRRHSFVVYYSYAYVYIYIYIHTHTHTSFYYIHIYCI